MREPFDIPLEWATLEEFSLPQAAKILGVHRVTILRMEQKKAIPKARWRREPQPHRVYNKEEMSVIRAKLVKNKEAKGREYVD